jgi:hypothetical protein
MCTSFLNSVTHNEIPNLSLLCTFQRFLWSFEKAVFWIIINAMLWLMSHELNTAAMEKSSVMYWSGN